MKRRSTAQRPAKNTRQLAMATGPLPDEPFRRPERRAPKRELRPRNENQAEMLATMEAATVTFGLGPAGTGKTYLAVGRMVAALRSGEVERLVFTRPAIEASGERLGFLPGNMKDKVDPYLRPIYDALHDWFDPQTVNRMLEAQQIEIAPLAFMRGRTFNNCAVLVDEAQNATFAQLKMALTRLGTRSRMVVTGDPDPSQVDLPDPAQSGLLRMSEELAGVPGVETVTFEKADIVRSRIVSEILARI